MDLVLIGFLTAVSFYIVMVKMGIGKFIKFGWLTDLVVSFIMIALFVGTFGGVVVGIIAGIFISLFLSITKLIAFTVTPREK